MEDLCYMLQVHFTGKNNRFPFLDILGYLRIPIKIPKLAKWDKSQPGNSQPSSLVGTSLTLPNLGFLWVFYTLKYPKMGICYFFCACGYSRRVIWLEFDRSNNDPKIPATFYLDAVHNGGGCPMIVWSDCGSGYVLVAAMQSYFWAGVDDKFAGSKAHQCGSSPSNQRIERWWSFFRQSHSIGE